MASRSVITTAAMMVAAALVGGCEARSSGMPPAADTAPQAPVQSVPQAPPELPAGLDMRVRQATDEAADAGATVEIAVLDRTTGQLTTNGANQPFPIASVVKLFIADDLLLRESQGETELSPADRKSLDAMLRSSDDSAAQLFWNRGGGNAIIDRVVGRYGLTGTIAPYDGGWDVAQSTAADLVRYYSKLLDGSGGLPAEQAGIIMSNLAGFTSSGLDGYPQRFGIPDGVAAEPVAVKQGWFCCWGGGNQVHVSTGAIGPDQRYVMAIGSLQPSDAATARETITQAVRTMFPGGHL